MKIAILSLVSFADILGVSLPAHLPTKNDYEHLWMSAKEAILSPANNCFESCILIGQEHMYLLTLLGWRDHLQNAQAHSKISQMQTWSQGVFRLDHMCYRPFLEIPWDPVCICIILKCTYISIMVLSLTIYSYIYLLLFMYL